MRRYELLRLAMRSRGMTGKDAGTVTGLSAVSVSARMTGQQPWSMEEAYANKRYCKFDYLRQGWRTMKRYYTVTMDDGNVYGIPAEIIADDYARYRKSVEQESER